MPASTPPPPEELALVDALAEAAGLHLLPEERQPVSEAFGTLHAIAQALLRFPLADDAESAEVFQP